MVPKKSTTIYGVLHRRLAMNGSFQHGHHNDTPSRESTGRSRRDHGRSRLGPSRRNRSDTDTERDKKLPKPLYGAGVGNAAFWGHHDDSSQDPLQDTFGEFPAPPPPLPVVSRPGAQYCTGMLDSGHDAYSEKEFWVDGKPQAWQKPSRLWIEIAAGMTERLRGAEETWACVENDSYLPTTCLACTRDLFCIIDASYVLCPICKVVSPIEGNQADGGVGLGFSIEDLQRWQCEIMARQRPLS